MSHEMVKPKTTKRMRAQLVLKNRYAFSLEPPRERQSVTGNIPRGGGGGILPFMGYIGMCRCEGCGFQAVYSSIGYINQSVWV